MFIRTQDSALADLLDRPIWSALTTHHRYLAHCVGNARFYPEDISPFAATRDNDIANLEALGRPADCRRGEIMLMQAGPIAYPDTLRRISIAPAIQMIADRAIDRPDVTDEVRLVARDAPEMLTLARLAKPGPFGPGTHRLGAFWGLRERGRLIAMAGERLRQPGFTEVSGVCVHPEHRGRGHARRLVALVAADIQARGETPYLHSLSANLTAIRVYRRLGFRTRCDMQTVRLEPHDGMAWRNAGAEESRHINILH